jgi:diguanylate cyclase (GGDEF)-like protein
MPVKRPSHEDPADPAFAHESRGGPADMRFEASLESAYRTLHLRRVRRRVRIWNSAGIVLVLVLTAGPLRRGGSALPALALAGVLAACAVALLWLSWSRHYERRYLPFGWILVALFNACVAVVAALALSHGDGERSALIAAILAGAFLFSGLMLHQALVAGAITGMAFAAGAFAVELPFGSSSEGVVAMLLAGCIAAIACRDLEDSHRRNFLQAARSGKLAARNGLTGLMNRLAFDEHLHRAWRQAVRERHPVAVLLIDIDHLERYVDQCGHVAGDFARRSIARLIQDVARRPLDLAAWSGGEEFIVFLHNLESTHAQYLAERLREDVQNLAHEADLWTGPEVTVSVGLGFVAPGVGDSAESAVQLADEALSTAKQAGNCVVVKGANAYVFHDTGAFDRAGPRRRFSRTSD